MLILVTMMKMVLVSMFSYENKKYKLLNENMHLCNITVKNLNFLTVTYYLIMWEVWERQM